MVGQVGSKHKCKVKVYLNPPSGEGGQGQEDNSFFLLMVRAKRKNSKKQRLDTGNYELFPPKKQR